ncbi:hypothetical protein [Gemmiger sp.]
MYIYPALGGTAAAGWGRDAQQMADKTLRELMQKTPMLYEI